MARGPAAVAVRVIIICFIGIALSITAVVLRLWSRYIQRAPLAFHDWMASIALVLALGSTSISVACKLTLLAILFRAITREPQILQC
jgi:hypothetical protein